MLAFMCHFLWWQGNSPTPRKWVDGFWVSKVLSQGPVQDNATESGKDNKGQEEENGKEETKAAEEKT